MDDSSAEPLIRLVISRFPDGHYEVDKGEVPPAYPDADFVVEWVTDPPIADFVIDKIWPSKNFEGSPKIIEGGRRAKGTVQKKKLPLRYNLRVSRGNETCLVYGPDPEDIRPCNELIPIGDPVVEPRAHPRPPPVIIIDA